MRIFWFFTNKAWLEGNLMGKAFGAYDERERIINLLQDQAVLCGRSGSQGHGLRCALRIVGDGCNCNEVIALIKGEK
jgi:hypothetical protein